MICETSPYPAGTDNIVQTASGSALVNLVDAEGTPIGSVKQGVSLPRDSFAGSVLNFPVRMCPPNGTFVRISQPFSGNAIKGPINAAVPRTGNSSVFRHVVLRAGFSCVLAECGLELQEWIKRAEIGSRNPTY